MTPQQQAEAQPKDKQPEYKPQTKLCAAYFVDSVPIEGEQTSVSIGRNCDGLYPARLEGDGSVLVVDKNQRADGLLIRRKVRNLATHERWLVQVFVPWSNVRALQYE